MFYGLNVVQSAKAEKWTADCAVQNNQFSHLQMEIGRNDSLLQVLHPFEDADIRLHCLLLHLPGFLQLLQEHILILYLQVKQAICPE